MEACISAMFAEASLPSKTALPVTMRSGLILAISAMLFFLTAPSIAMTRPGLRRRSLFTRSVTRSKNTSFPVSGPIDRMKTTSIWSRCGVMASSGVEG